ncbi:MAG: BCCT family transporter [Lachnospiraceae bacterium]
MDKKPKYKLYKVAFFVALAILLIEIIFGVFFQEQFGSLLNNAIYFVGDNFGWFINILSLIAVLAAVAVAFFKFGDIKIGGPDAKPEFKFHNWCFMAICGGIGCGLLFWALGEPMYHLMTPPVAAAVESGSREAAIFAVGQAMFDWTFVQYCLYSLCGVLFALIAYNLKKTLSFGSLIECSFKRKIPWLMTLIHIIAIFCLASAVANSMGAGLLQLGAGFENIFNIAQGPILWLVIAVGVGVFFIMSCVAGMSKGLKYVSNITILLFAILIVYILVAGDAQFIGKISTEAIGNMFDNFFSKITYNNTLVPEDQWANEWTITFWNSFFIYAPVIGMFLARMAKGRTVRQFLAVNILIPSAFCIVWIGIFGGMAVKVQTSGALDIWEMINSYGMQTTVYQFLSTMPYGNIAAAVFLVAVIFSFCTLADPMCSVLATLCVRDLQIDDEPPKNIKILMGVIVTIIAYLLVSSGGMDSVKGLLNIGGLLMSLPTAWCFIEVFRQSSHILTLKDFMVQDDMIDIVSVKDTLEVNDKTVTNN